MLLLFCTLKSVDYSSMMTKQSATTLLMSAAQPPHQVYYVCLLFPHIGTSMYSSFLWD